MSFLSVLIARHAEKPNGAFPGPGLTPEGEEDKKSLVIRGWQRTGAWAALFGSGLGGPDYPRPQLVYAAKPEPIDEGAKFSHRPYETALPTAARLHLPVIATWGVGQERELVDAVLRLTGTVLIFWEHKAIPAAIIPALLGAQTLPGVPVDWDGDRFDVVLRFDRALPTAPWSYRQLSPLLLDGDSDRPVGRVAGTEP
ncbi:histidine phosphatase family protein [Methylobacterium sp. JK268]